MSFFESVEPIQYEGPESDNPLAFRWYQPDRVVGDRTMAEHLRFAVCYWHSFAWDGFDIFGAGTLDRPWHPNNAPDLDPMDAARMKMDAAFEFISKLGRRLLLVPRHRHRAGRRHLRGDVRLLRPDGRLRRPEDGRHRHRADVGHDQRVLAPTLHVGCRDQPRSRSVPVRGGPGRPLHAEDARARGRQLCPVGWTRGLRDTPQHRHGPRARSARSLHEHGRRAQVRDRVRGHPPDRAEGHGADQASVRLRRRDGLLVSCRNTASRTRSRSTSRPITPPCRGTTSTTRSRPPSTPASSARSTPTPATIASAGISTSSRPRSRTCRSACSRSCAAVASPPAA